MEDIKVADNTGIYQAVTDYYEGWYIPNARQMSECLHKDFVKRAIKQDAAEKEYLLHLTKDIMVDATSKESRAKRTDLLQCEVRCEEVEGEHKEQTGPLRKQDREEI